jgi:hypothetical protein
MVRQKILVLVLSLFAVAAIAQPPQGRGGAQMPQQMQMMRAQMQAMQAQMERIQQTEDPAERRRLMQEHMQSMSQGMMMMGQMMGGAMPGGPQRDDQGGAAQGAQCAEGDTQCQMNRMQMQQRMMGQQMGMMQQMMGQMMGHMMQMQSGDSGAQ